MFLPTERKWYQLALIYGLLFAGLVIVAVPFLLMVSTSLKPQQYTFEYPPRLIPSEVTLNNYVQALGKDLFFL
jgi:multiple sugar transport system permease protein